MMVMAGRTMAQFTSDNLIPVPYALQDKGDFSEEFRLIGLVTRK
jgi:hypothetical protein